MNKGTITFNANDRLDDEYKSFMDKLIEFSGEYSVMERKDNDDVWKEVYVGSRKIYVIATVFTGEEVEFLSKEYPSRFSTQIRA